MIGDSFFGNKHDVAKKRRMLWWQIPFLLFLCVGTFYIVRQQHSVPFQKDSGMIFGTFYNITYQSDKNLKEEIVEVLKRVDSEFSMFNDTSAVSRFNRGENIVLSPMFIDVYRMATAIHDETNGAFDITIAPLVNAWGFGFKTELLPDSMRVDSLREVIGMDKIQLNEKEQRLSKTDERVMLDFSAIAKGYGSDCVAQFLRDKGIDNFMVEIGGEVVTQGISPKRLPWRIGVTKPVEDSLNTNQELQTVLNVTDLAMATSGNYRNFYYKGGHKYAHTIDPRTGYPVQHSLLSSTVLAKNCATADAYATAFMVMGLERAKEILEKHKELKAYFIYTNSTGDYDVWFSPSLKDKINE